jgi:hypothetical protein
MTSENFETLNKNEEPRSEIFDRNAQDQYGKSFQELSPHYKIKLLKSIFRENPEEAYIKTSDKKELLELGRGMGSMKQVTRKHMENTPEVFWESMTHGLYFDGSTIVLDKDVSERLLDQHKDWYIKKEIQRIQNESGQSYTDAKNRVLSEIDKEIATRRENMEKSREAVGKYGFSGYTLDLFFNAYLVKTVAEADERLKEIGIIAPRAIVFTNIENTDFVAIDGRYYTGLSEEWKNPAFYTKNPNLPKTYPHDQFVILKSEGEVKALILPVRISSSHTQCNKMV